MEFCFTSLYYFNLKEKIVYQFWYVKNSLEEN